MEEWKIYKKSGAPYYRTYEVSNMGRVKVNGDIVEPHLHNKYLIIGSYKVHRMVAEMFIPNPENKPHIDHINTDCLDNRACNLRWVTPKENMNNPITKNHISNSKLGKPSGMLGKKQSEYQKHKMSQMTKGKKMKKEFCEACRKRVTGKHWKLVDGKRVWY